MIVRINGRNHGEYSSMITSMYRLRAEVFSERLGWDVTVSDGLEIDRFDACDPLYLLSINDRGELMGSLRVLPTTGPNMLRDVFSVLLSAGEQIESPLIWESTRFCVTKQAQGERSLNRLNRTTGELLLGLFETAQNAGISYVVSVYDAYMRRVLDQAGCHAEIIGEPKRIGRVLTYAGLFEVNDKMIARLRVESGIDASIFHDGNIRSVA
ncbi:MAG: GNAT family N-acetyltransferase [Rhodocyclaceae bacterium]|jgi:N-acyl-L-homoserine lactone synthetase|nr:GNAT family N-acetyltransferase [Rhodocyclaceae bacterium]